MVEDYSCKVAYSCPRCGRFHKHDLSIFDIGLKGITFNCHDCRLELLKIKPARGKFYFEYLCPFCGEKHSASFAQKGFWRRDGLGMTCDQIGIEAVLFGKSETIDNMIDLDKAADDLIPKEITCLYGIVERLKELELKNAIGCGYCGANEIDLRLEAEGIRLICRSCGESALITPDEQALNMLNNSNTYVIE